MTMVVHKGYSRPSGGLTKDGRRKAIVKPWYVGHHLNKGLGQVGRRGRCGAGGVDGDV